MKKFFILLLFFATTSCASIFMNSSLKKNGVFNTKSKLKTFENKERKKKILFLGMHHIGRKEFYDDVAAKVDSLQKLNYTVFYENLTDSKEIDSLVTIKSAMKLRKLIGYFIQKHMDTTTNIIAGKFKYRGKYKLMNQPNYRKLNVDSLTAIKADAGLTELITAFEKNNSEIKLDDCDYSFKLKDRDYNCKKVSKKLNRVFRMDYIAKYRDKILAKKIHNSNKNKILVIYGKAHFWGLYFQLKSLDKEYKINKNSIP